MFEISGSVLKMLNLHISVVQEAGVRGVQAPTKSFDLLIIRAKSLKIWAKSLKIWEKSLKIRTKSLNILAKSLTSAQKCRRTLFYFEKWRPRLAEKQVKTIFVGHTTKTVGKSFTITFSASLVLFGQKSFAPPKICFLLHLCHISLLHSLSI